MYRLPISNSTTVTHRWSSAPVKSKILFPLEPIGATHLQLTVRPKIHQPTASETRSQTVNQSHFLNVTRDIGFYAHLFILLNRASAVFNKLANLSPYEQTSTTAPKNKTRTQEDGDGLMGVLVGRKSVLNGT